MDGVAQAGSASAAGGDVSVPVLVGGRYELGALLGQGGSARVYRATDRSLHRQVAVKMLHDGEASTEQAARFEREVTLQAGLAHPGLIPLLDAGLDEERPYLVMPLIQGTTLAERIASGPLAGREAAHIGAVLAGALDCVHAHQIVHRDVKPANVLLGRDGHVFLADFGIATRHGEPDQNTPPRFSMTGTAAYLPPEQVENGTIDYPGDIYALGLVLLEALTGTRAYHGTMLEQALARLWRQPEIPATLGPGWSRLLEAMTARDPEQRPQPHHITETLNTLTNPTPAAPAHRWTRPTRNRTTTPATARSAHGTGSGPPQAH
jgi:eukaryotic-like serine/threonine-protein kinase